MHGRGLVAEAGKRMSPTILGIMGCHGLASWYEASKSPGSWAFIRYVCPNKSLSAMAEVSRGGPFVVEAHQRCAKAIVLAWRDRVSHG